LVLLMTGMGNASESGKDVEVVGLRRMSKRHEEAKEEEIHIIFSRPAAKLLSRADLERFRGLLLQVCKEMGFRTAYISKSWGSLGVCFVREELRKIEESGVEKANVD